MTLSLGQTLGWPGGCSSDRRHPDTWIRMTETCRAVCFMRRAEGFTHERDRSSVFCDLKLISHARSHFNRLSVQTTDTIPSAQLCAHIEGPWNYCQRCIAWLSWDTKIHARYYPLHASPPPHLPPGVVAAPRRLPQHQPQELAFEG